MGVVAVGVEGARDALIQGAEVEADVELVGRLPAQVRVRNGAGLEANEVVAIGRVPRAVQQTERLVRSDRAVTDATIAQAQLQVRDTAHALHERLVADLPGERRGGEEREFVSRCQHAGTVFASRQGEGVSIEQRVVHAAHPRLELRLGEEAVDRRRRAGAQVVPELVLERKGQRGSAIEGGTEASNFV